jgi:hypothetical protein
MDERAKVEGVVLIHQPTEYYLNSRQRVAYRSRREKLIKWLAKQGKNPEKLEEYAYDTYCSYSNIIDQFHRTVWDENGQFTLDLSHEQVYVVVCNLQRQNLVSEVVGSLRKQHSYIIFHYSENRVVIVWTPHEVILVGTNRIRVNPVHLHPYSLNFMTV